MNELAENDQCTASCASLISTRRNLVDDSRLIFLSVTHQRNDLRSICLKPRKNYPLPLPKSVPHITNSFINEHLCVYRQFSKVNNKEDKLSLSKPRRPRTCKISKLRSDTILTKPKISAPDFKLRENRSLCIKYPRSCSSSSSSAYLHIVNNNTHKSHKIPLIYKQIKSNIACERFVGKTKKTNQAIGEKNKTVTPLAANEQVYCLFEGENCKPIGKKYTADGNKQPEGSVQQEESKHKEIIKATESSHSSTKSLSTIRRFWKQKAIGSINCQKKVSPRNLIYDVNYKKYKNQKHNKCIDNNSVYNIETQSKNITTKLLENVDFRHKIKQSLIKEIIQSYKTYVYKKIDDFSLKIVPFVKNYNCNPICGNHTQKTSISASQQCQLQIAFSRQSMAPTDVNVTHEVVEEPLGSMEPTCSCACTCKNLPKCQWKMCQYATISESLFLGPTLDEIILAALGFLRRIGEIMGLIKPIPKKDVNDFTCSLTRPNNDIDLDAKSNQMDVVKWLHDEYLTLAKDVAEANAAAEHDCPCSKENCPIVLQSRRFVLDRLAELLEKKQELEIAYSKKYKNAT